MCASFANPAVQNADASKGQAADGMNRALEGAKDIGSGIADATVGSVKYVGDLGAAAVIQVGSEISSFAGSAKDYITGTFTTTKNAAIENVIVPAANAALAAKEAVEVGATNYARDFNAGLGEVAKDWNEAKAGVSSAWQNTKAGVASAVDTVTGLPAAGLETAKSLHNQAVEATVSHVIDPTAEAFRDLTGITQHQQELQIARMESQLQNKPTSIVPAPVAEKTIPAHVTPDLFGQDALNALFASNRYGDSPSKSLQIETPKMSNLSLSEENATIKSGTTEAKQLQEILNKLSPEAGLEVDGIVGEKTIAAISSFQREAGLNVDGIAGKETIAAINKALFLEASQNILAKN